MRANTDVKTFILYDERECGSCFHVLLRSLELQGGEQDDDDDQSLVNQGEKKRKKNFQLRTNNPIIVFSCWWFVIEANRRSPFFRLNCTLLGVKLSRVDDDRRKSKIILLATSTDHHHQHHYYYDYHRTSVWNDSEEGDWLISVSRCPKEKQEEAVLMQVCRSLLIRLSNNA